MSLYQAARLLHVLIAILGLGQVVAIAVVASAARSEATAPPWASHALRWLARWTGISLLLMMLSAALIEYATGGGYHQALWFRASFALWVALGFLQGRIRRALRKTDPAEALTAGTLLGVQRGSLAMCALVGVLVVLMELKPG
jgi:hypothetical protein